MSGRDKGKGNTMVLPNIPKMTDDKNRIKYMTDYEKYEPELLKHHIGNAETTTTIGLKNVPAEFDRTVPSPSDPTVAEVEYEKYVALRNARRKKKRFHASTPGDIVVTKPKPKVSVTVPSSPAPAASSTPAADWQSTPAKGSADHSADGTASGEAAPGAGATVVPPISTDLKVSSASDTKVVLHTPTSVSRPQRKRGGSKSETKQATPASKTVPEPVLKPSISNSTFTHDAGRPLSETSSASRMSGAQSKGFGAASSKLPAVHSIPVKKPATAPSGFSARRVHSSPTRASTPPKGSPPREPIKPPKKEMSAEEVQKYLAENCPPGPTVTKIEPASLGADAAECADILRVIVDPPPEYAASVKIELKGLDIDWIVEKRRRPNQLTTLQNWQSMTTPNVAPRITSPRSVLVLLRNGVSTNDLRPHLPKDDDVLLPQDPELRAAVKRYRIDRDKVRRDELNELLLTDYVNICSKFSQQELILAVNKPPDLSEKANVLPTSLLERQEKQKKQFEINKIRMSRANELAESVHQKRVAAEERRLRAEEEMRENLEAKAKAEEDARKMQQQRLAEQKRKLEMMERVALENLKQRQALAEKRNQERLEAQERQFQIRQQIRKEKEEERQRRFARAALMQEQQAELVMKKREEIERKLAEIEEIKRQKVEEDQRLLKEKQMRVKQARKEAAKRAAEQEEKIRQAAMEKQEHVQQRIERFLEAREMEAQQRAEMEREKSMRRREAFQHAQEMQEEFKVLTAEKRQQHEVVYQGLVEQKQLMLTMHREQEREEMANKASAIRMLQRVEEFKKLGTVAQLIEKKRIAEHVEKQRQEILAKSLLERDKLNAEKAELRQRLESAKV